MVSETTTPQVTTPNGFANCFVDVMDWNKTFDFFGNEYKSTQKARREGYTVKTCGQMIEAMKNGLPSIVVLDASQDTSFVNEFVEIALKHQRPLQFSTKMIENDTDPNYVLLVFYYPDKITDDILTMELKKLNLSSEREIDHPIF